MKKKKRIFKNLTIIGVLMVFFAVVFGVLIFKNQEIFSEGIKNYNLTSKTKTEINIEEIRGKIDDMSLEEIEETISEIEKEIKRLNAMIVGND